MSRGVGGAGVLELIEDHRGDTYRAVYTVRFDEAIYVLHAFQKKAKRGSARGLTQVEAAKLLGTTQAQVSALMRLLPVSVSVGRLMEFLTVLGQDVEVTVKPARARRAGHMSVVVEPA